MSSFHRWIVSTAIVLCTLLAGLIPAHAKMTDWPDMQGGTFRGEPTDILGPFVVFRTSGDKGRRFPLRAFSSQDCLRIYQEIATKPPRADRFDQAQGSATRKMIGKVSRVERKELVVADLTGQPEPEVILVLAGSNNNGAGWFMVSNLNSFYWRVRHVYPGLMEGIFIGARHDIGQHRNIAITSGMPWLVADFHQQQKMPEFTRYLPGENSSNVALVTRQGVPLVASKSEDTASMRKFFDEVSTLLWQIDPANPIGWADRLHYLKTTRPVEFAQSRSDPVLIGDPFRPAALRNYGVKRIVARLAITPDGKVTPTILSGPEDLPSDLKAPLTAALAQAVVAPAIDHGQPVAGTLDYELVVPAPNPPLEANQVWLSSSQYPELPIENWLVLRPIIVAEKDFESLVIGEKADGTVILNAVEVNTGKISRAAQMSAFNTDFFAETGAGSVRPKEGDRQMIDVSTELTWERIQSQDGFVEMQTGIPKDYTVGYAWAEFDSPRDTDAWLGLGSDDGVKIWLNGVLVHDRWIRRPSRVDDEIVPLHLKQGSNQILIKIQNATIHWSFIYRLRLKP